MKPATERLFELMIIISNYNGVLHPYDKENIDSIILNRIMEIKAEEQEYANSESF